MQKCLRTIRFSLGWLLLLAVQLDAEQLPLKLYTTADGLAHENILEIVRDSQGFLWFCTLDGLSRFDGYRFVNYGVRDGLPHSSVYDLLESRTGAYWLATFAGVTRFVPGRNSRSGTGFFTTYPVDGKRVVALYEDRAGNLWVGTTNGVYRLKANSPQVAFERIELGITNRVESPVEVSAICGDAEGNIWIGSTHGLTRLLPDGRPKHYTIKPSENMDMIWTLLCDPQGRVWIAHYSGFLIFKPEPAAQTKAQPSSLLPPANPVANLVNGRLLLPDKPGEVRWYKPQDGLEDPNIRAFCQTDSGSIWLGTRGGPLSRFDGERFTSYSAGLTRRVTALAEDEAGNLWVGARSGGVIRVARRGLVTFRQDDGLAINDVLSVGADRTGTLTVISNAWYISQLNRQPGGARFHSITLNLPKQLSGSSVGNREMVQDRQGDWWISSGAGVARFSGVQDLNDLARLQPRVYTTRDGLADDNVNRLFADSRGDIWCSSYHPPITLARYERATNTWHRYGESDGMPKGNWANRITEDRAGNVWFGMHEGGLLRWRQGRFEYFGQTAGVPIELVQGISVDRSGRLWAGTKGRGAVRCDDPTAATPHFTRHTVAQGLASDVVESVVEDRWGRVYITHARGVDRLEIGTGRIQHITADDGLAPGEVVTAFADQQGALWFGSREGLSQLIPTEHDVSAPPPSVVISGLRAAGQPQAVAELGERELRGLRLEPNQNQIELDFLGVNFALGAPPRYQYKFEGYDRDWSAPSEQRTVAAKLAPGSYRFLVRALNAEGQVSDPPASVSFTILPPVWQRWWFLALVLALLSAVVFFANRYHINRLLEIERVRTRIATDLHDDIGASLSRMAILSEAVKQTQGQPNGQPNGHQAQATAMLTEIADSARGLVDSMSDLVWAIDPRRDDLQQVIARARQFTADVFEVQGVNWSFIAPPDIAQIKLDPERRRHLFLILKEAINNAAKYADCRDFSITLEVTPQQLTAEIRDDGCGFDYQLEGAALATGVISKARGGNGLKNMHVRAAELGGSLNIKSASGKGTRLRLMVPLKK
jgi:ligand-binding sensor domain-containing protein/signal transduction histidine kinase